MKGKRRRWVWLLGGLVAVLLAAGLLLAANYGRIEIHQRKILSSVQPAIPESAEREIFKRKAGDRLFRGDFEGIDSLARELRASRAAFSDGTWKLTVLYDGLGRPDSWSEGQWTRALDRAEAWRRERPSSITARIVGSELWSSYAWVARGSRWAKDVTEPQWAAYRWRIEQAAEIMKGAEAVEERCPRRAATLIALAAAESADPEKEARIFHQAVRDDPDYQPVYTKHLYFLQPRWHGAPGDFERAGREIAALPGGAEKYARAIWSLDRMGRWDRQVASWPLLKQGLRDMRRRYPGSFEITSVACYFAWTFQDRDEARQLLSEIGFRMDPTVWDNPERFAAAVLWATFEDTEKSGDPLARLFARLMGA